jgi:protein-S-isoprenylcysteine O-methyltransferase Ste14
MRSRTTRSLAVPLLLASGMVAGLLTAAPASALTTRACTQKGTKGNETMTVNLTPGGMFVVCAFTGTDTVNLRGTVDTTTVLVIVFGTGAKTVDLGLSSVTADYMWQVDSVLIRPTVGSTVALTGTYGMSNQFNLACGTNANYGAESNAYDVYLHGGFHQIQWAYSYPPSALCDG